MIFWITFAAFAQTTWNIKGTCAAEMDPAVEHILVYEGVTDRAGRANVLQAPLHPNRVKLDGFFVAMNMVSDLIRPISIQPGEPLAKLIAMAHLEWDARKTDVLFSLNLGMVRGPILHRKRTPGNPDFDRLLLDPMARIYGPLPERYARQGPERAELAAGVHAQDRQEWNRTTRFSLSRFDHPLAYAQVLTSHGAHEPLHVQVAHGDQVADFTRVEPGQIIGELGRLALAHPNLHADDYGQPRVKDARASAVIARALMQKILAWVNSDARLDRLVFQVNFAVERRLRLARVPLELGRRREVTKAWGPEGRQITEVVYAFDRPALLRAEERLLSLVLGDWLRYALRQPYFQIAPLHRIHVFIQANEAAAFKRLGLYPALFGSDLPLEAFGHSMDTAIVIGLDQIPEALAYLRRREYEARPVGDDPDDAEPFVTEPYAAEWFKSYVRPQEISASAVDRDVRAAEGEHRKGAVDFESQLAARLRDDAVAGAPHQVDANGARTPNQIRVYFPEIGDLMVAPPPEKAQQLDVTDRSGESAQGEREVGVILSRGQDFLERSDERVAVPDADGGVSSAGPPKAGSSVDVDRRSRGRVRPVVERAD